VRATYAHSNNTRPPASVRISVMRADFPYCLQCRSASACTAFALAANHLSTRALVLPGGGGDDAHAENVKTVAMIIAGLKIMTHCPWLGGIRYALRSECRQGFEPEGPACTGVQSPFRCTTAEILPSSSSMAGCLCITRDGPIHAPTDDRKFASGVR
jgi:hypothetical protein